MNEPKPLRRGGSITLDDKSATEEDIDNALRVEEKPQPEAPTPSSPAAPEQEGA